jgi:hypothetical protein
MAGRVDQVQRVGLAILGLVVRRTVWALMVMPRSRSISIESSTCSFISRSVRPPQVWISRSASVDLPWSIWATMEKLRIIGFDAGGNASRVFTLVYRLNDTDRLYQRFPGVEGSAYFVAGLGVNYQRADGITLAPIRSGVGLRAGANVGYLAYSRQRNWIPF